MSKNLLYFCVYYNVNYFKLLNLLLTSLKFYSSGDDYDILILTHQNMTNEVDLLKNKLKINIMIKTYDFNTIFEAAYARLYIFDYENIDNYDKILYVDTDIIIKNNLSIIFNLDIDDKLYAIESGNIESINFGGQFFNFGKNDKSCTGMNSGTLLFKNTKNMQNLFTRIIGHIHVFLDSNQNIPYAMDQPFINYHAVRSNLYDNKLLNKYVSLYEDTDTVDNFETSVICHFSFPIGNFIHKYKRMTTFLTNILMTKLNNVDDSQQEIIINKKYIWNGGFVLFEKSRLKTTWDMGKYEFLDNDKLLLSWHNYNHIIKFNEDYGKFISIRITPNDFDVTFCHN